MADPVITNIDVGQIVVQDAKFQQIPITFAGADTLVAGTILAGTVADANKYGVFVKGAVDITGIATGVLTYEVVAAGAGDITSSVLVAGEVNADRLIIDADGDGSNVDQEVLDTLRDNHIVGHRVEQLGQLDNQ